MPSQQHETRSVSIPLSARDRYRDNAPVALIGVGIGSFWAFIAQHVMAGARAGAETITAASVATVQQAGIAFGATVAGLVANASGFGDGLHPSFVLRAAFWVPMAFVAAPLVAATIGMRLNLVARRSVRESTIATNNGERRHRQGRS